MNDFNKKWRYSMVGAFTLVLPVLIVLQVIRIQVDPEQVERLMDQSNVLSWERRVITPARGLIYDRWGSLLAGKPFFFINLANTLKIK